MKKRLCIYQGTPEEPDCQYCDGVKDCCVPPEEADKLIGGEGTTHWYICSACGAPIDQADNFCRNCGKKFSKIY